MSTEAKLDFVDRENISEFYQFLPDAQSLGERGFLAEGLVQSPIIFNFENIGFYVSRRHWDNPSNWYIRKDGTWYFFAKRVANFNKSWGDTGPTHSIAIDVEYFDGWDDANQTVGGTRVHSARHGLATVRYKQELHNHSRTGQDARFAELYNTIRSVRLTSWWL